MTKSLLATCAVFAVLCHQWVAAGELALGSKAPKLELGKFVKGEEVKGFEKGKIYVVELWATWCGPCLNTIPHLTELQEKYQKVTFIGVAVLEQDPSTIPDFVEKMGEKMEYRVALDLVEGDDPNDGQVVKNWLEPAELDGIPAAFVINGEGKIAWIGHPAEMEEPLAKIVDGKWDLEAEAEKIAEKKATLKKKNSILTKVQELYNEFKNGGQSDELLPTLDSAGKELPDYTLTFQLISFQVLSMIKDRADDAVAAATKLLESEQANEPKLLGDLAWIVVNPDRETKADPKLLKLALKLALKADSLANNEDASIADTLAKAYFDNGDLAKAVKAEERAIELIQGAGMAADPTLNKRLKQYKKAMDAASAKK